MRGATIRNCTVGADINITPENKPYIIELNGFNSGINGLQELTGDDIPAIRQRAKQQLLLSLSDQPTKTILPPVWEELLEIYRKSGMNHEAPKTHPTHIMMPSDDGLSPHEIKYGHSRAFERTCNDKALQKQYIPEEYKAPYVIWNEAYYFASVMDSNSKGDEWGNLTFMGLHFSLCANRLLEKMGELDWPDPEKIIIAKNSMGAHGSNVETIRLTGTSNEDTLETLSKVLRLLKNDRGDILFEALIPSKRIDEHANGTMRYLADFMVITNENGESRWTKTWEGAYWRIPPTPVEVDEKLVSIDEIRKKYVINFTGGNPAKPHIAQESEIALARLAVRKTIDNMAADGIFA